MAFDSDRHHRRSVRLKGYDYAQGGAYFVTVCIQHWECLLGDVVDGQMVLSEWGLIASEAWERVAQHWPTVGLDGFVVMPNHFHGIVVLGGEEGGGTPPLQGAQVGGGPTLGAVFAYWKYQTSKAINEMRQSPGARLWQRSFHDRVIRNDWMLTRGRAYIANNPVRWPEDVHNPANILSL